MSNLLRPVGPLPPRVYWVRRLLVLALAVLVVIVTATIVVKAIGSDSGSEADGGAANSAADAAAKKSASGTPADCTKEDIGLTLSASGTTFASGQQPTFSVEVSNIGEVPCLVDVNAKTLSVDVVSGKDEIWSSVFCVKAQPELLLIGGDDVHKVAKEWDRMRNDKNCSKQEVAAKPGTYRAVASLRGAKSKESVFTLN